MNKSLALVRVADGVAHATAPVNLNGDLLRAHMVEPDLASRRSSQHRLTKSLWRRQNSDGDGEAQGHPTPLL